MEEKEFISRWTGAFLTKRACKEYTERYHYNHSKPHTYAMTAYRNFEYERLLKILKTMEMGDSYQMSTKGRYQTKTEGEV